MFGRHPEKYEARAIEYERKGNMAKAQKNRDKAARWRAKGAGNNLPVVGGTMHSGRTFLPPVVTLNPQPYPTGHSPTIVATGPFVSAGAPIPMNSGMGTTMPMSGGMGTSGSGTPMPMSGGMETSMPMSNGRGASMPMTTGEMGASMPMSGGGMGTSCGTGNSMPMNGGMGPSMPMSGGQMGYMPGGTVSRYETNATKWEGKGNFKKAQKNREKVWKLNNPNANTAPPCFYQGNKFMGYNGCAQSQTTTTTTTTTVR